MALVTGAGDQRFGTGGVTGAGDWRLTGIVDGAGGWTGAGTADQAMMTAAV